MSQKNTHYRKHGYSERILDVLVVVKLLPTLKHVINLSKGLATQPPHPPRFSFCPSIIHWILKKLNDFHIKMTRDIAQLYFSLLNIITDFSLAHVSTLKKNKLQLYQWCCLPCMMNNSLIYMACTSAFCSFWWENSPECRIQSVSARTDQNTSVSAWLIWTLAWLAIEFIKSR